MIKKFALYNKFFSFSKNALLFPLSYYVHVLAYKKSLLEMIKISIYQIIKAFDNRILLFISPDIKK